LSLAFPYGKQLYSYTCYSTSLNRIIQIPDIALMRLAQSGSRENY